MYIYLRKLRKVKDPKKKKKEKPKKTGKTEELTPSQQIEDPMVELMNEGHYMVSEELANLAEADIDEEIQIVEMNYEAGRLDPTPQQQQQQPAHVQSTVSQIPVKPEGGMIYLQKLKKLKKPKKDKLKRLTHK